MNVVKGIYLSSLFVAVATFSVASAPLRASTPDERIESSAKSSYVFQNYLRDDEVRVESKEGVVTLTGTVASESHKSLAEETVAALPGVKSVEDKLEIKGGAPTPFSDSWVGDKVKTTLLFHRSVSGLHTDVDVKAGVVTLTGVASSQAEKELATEYAKDVDGVKGVENRMTVAASPEGAHRTAGQTMDDSSITTQVKLALLFHKSTSAIQTKVKTRNGVITLRGVAKNRAEKQLVTKIAEDIHGVVKVENEMTIGNAK